MKGLLIRRSLLVALGVLSLLSAAPAFIGHVSAQDASGRPRVFLDCNGRDCDSQYYRTEIDWVDWVNVREAADVHLIFTSQSTGAGGTEYQLDFLGRDQDDEYVDEMRYQALPTDTDRERLDGLANAIGIGLARFASTAGFRGVVRVEGVPSEGQGPGDRIVSQEEVEDPWNLWVFRIGANGNLEGESQSKEERVSGSLNASRVTPTWKVNLNANVNYSEREFELEDGTFEDSRYDWGFRPYVVYSLSDHWSLGVRGETARIIRFNQAFRWEVTPAVEYSLFPYEEATRRALTFSYRVGPAYRAYVERTLYDEMYETRVEHAFEVDLSQRQTWGEAGASISASQFLFLPDDPEYEDGLYNVQLRGEVEFRIVRGFNVDVSGNIGWVQDQIYLSAGGVSDEEALLRLQQRATDFEYRLNIGFSYQFGSIYNNVVNNRFNQAQGFGGRFFR
jgi:hypothetical protein